jgi:C-terminal peptidase prc
LLLKGDCLGPLKPKFRFIGLILVLCFKGPLYADSEINSKSSSNNAIQLPRLDSQILNNDTPPQLSNNGKEDRQFRLIVQAIEEHTGKKLSQEDVADKFVAFYQLNLEHFKEEKILNQYRPEAVEQIQSLMDLTFTKDSGRLVLTGHGKTKEFSLRKNLDWIAKESVKQAEKLAGAESKTGLPILWFLWVEASLDVLDSPYNYYIYANEMAADEAMRMGKTFGPGLIPEISGESVVVRKVFDPALEKLGLTENSTLTALDGEALAAENSHLFNKWLQPEKFHYQVSFKRNDTVKTVEAEAIPYRYPTLTWAKIRDFVYVRISQFSRDSLIELRRLFRLFKQTPPKGLVIDLRGNPGGVANIGLVDCFFKPGELIGTYKEIGHDVSDTVEGTIEYYDYPAALLVDSLSASMSEVFTAAFLKNKRGAVIGEKTFGKGVGQSCQPIGQEGRLCLVEYTFYYPGTENTWDGVGISPDIQVEISEGDRKQVYAFLSETIPDLEAQVKIDPVLNKALSFLGDNGQ